MTMLSLATVLAEAARKYPEKIAVIDGPVKKSYRDLWSETLAYAAGLRELGVKPGDTVAIQIPNLLDFPRVYYATLAVGATIVPMHLLLTPEENAYVLRDSGASLLVAHSSQLANAAAAASMAGVKVASVGPMPADVPNAPPRLEDVSAGVAPLRTYVSREAEDVAVVFYTSGTTGQAQGRPAHPPQPGDERDWSTSSTSNDVRRGRHRDGLSAAVPHLRPDRRDERHLPARRDARSCWPGSPARPRST